MGGPTPWYRSRRGRAVVALYGALTLFGLVISTGYGVPEGVFLLPDGQAPVPTTVPTFVYLYGFLGAMAYAFTSIVAKVDRGVTGVLKVGLRALAALPLAAGVFLLSGALGLPLDDGRLVAGAAFLVGLYVNLTLKALGGLAERLYGGSSSDD